MALLNTLAKYVLWFIFALFLMAVLYFPTMELAVYVARETRLFEIPDVFPIDDTLLPLLCLAIIYSIVAWLNRRVERRLEASKESE